MKKKNAQVIVVGAGPVGVVAAYRLALSGVDVLLLESNPDCPEDLRASTFHPPTLEMMRELGIIDELHELGLKAPIYQYRNRRTNETYSFDLSELSDITDYPYRLQCEQFKLSRLLANRLEAHPNADIKFMHRVLNVEQDSNGVTVNVETPFQIETFRADYLIGCDGANSIVRKWLNIGFEGFTYPEKFVTFSTQLPLEDYFDDLSLVNYVADPDEWMVLLRVPSVWRVLVPAPETDDAYLVSDAKKQDVFHNLIGDPTTRTEHRTIYKVHQRVAENYVVGRVMLAGDAAHLNNPLGGFGMNSGVHDVWNLTGKLISILQENDAAEPLLKLYERQRQAVMRTFVQAQTIRNKETLENRDPDAQAKHQKNLEAILADDERRRQYLLGQAMYNSLEQEKETA